MAMAKDQQGLTLAGSPQSAEAFDRAVADYFGLTGDPVGILKQALKNDPDFALGGVAIAGLFMIGGFRGDHPEVTEALAAAESAMRGASSRERMHLAAVKAWSEGRSPEAAQVWEAILKDWPTDALAFRFGQDAYLFLGRSLSIRDSAARVLPVWDRDNPLTSFVLGAYAFGLEEAGDLGPAEDAGREALARNPRDAWAAHAIAHVMETAGRGEEGVAFLRQTRPDWSDAHFMAGHNGWHLALFLIEQGRLKEVLADYDRFAAAETRRRHDARPGRRGLAPLAARTGGGGRRKSLGAGGAGVDGPCRRSRARLQRSALRPRRRALAGAGRPRPVPAVAGRLRTAWRGPQPAGHGGGRPALHRRRDRLCGEATGDGAIDAILPVRFETFRIGGSHAQRDVINRTLFAAAERAGDRALVKTLRDERGRRAGPHAH